MLNFKNLHIVYADPGDYTNEYQITYRLRDTPITYKWVERVLAAQQSGYPIDDPNRFYGFGKLEDQTHEALDRINKTIDKLNQWILIDYRLQSVYDQDTLNRLHHIFEIEHGLLDKKDTDVDYKQELCNLNLLVHCCESVARGANPRHVVTYFGLPKTQTLGSEYYQYFDTKVNFGTVYINYAEIGKTLFDLMMDNDAYIKPEAFQPFRHYSADFVVRFWNDKNDGLYTRLENYYRRHHDFFESIGYTWENLSRSIGSIPVADIESTGNVLHELETRQFVKAVHFS